MAMAEGIMTSILTFDAAEFFRCVRGYSSNVKDPDEDRQ